MGLETAHRSLNQKNKAIQSAFERGIGSICRKIESLAKLKAPVDTGHMRSQIESVYHKAHSIGWALGVTGEVRANPYYAKFMELGTGVPGRIGIPKEGFGPRIPEVPEDYSYGPKHNVSWKYLVNWCRRHRRLNVSPHAVAAAIRRARGMKPRPFLWPAVKHYLPEIESLIGREIKVAMHL